MASKTEIANLAISHLGTGKEIANIESEQSQEAKACRRYYEISKENTLRDLDWPFATKMATLNLIKEDPTDEWSYSYGYPVDCIKLRRVISSLRTDTLSTMVPYKILKGSTGKILYSDEEDASVEYTENINDSKFFDNDFTMALSFKLAYYIAPRLTAGDPYKLREQMAAAYLEELAKAKSNALTEETHDVIPDSELLSIRN